MPIKEFECPACGNIQEEILKSLKDVEEQFCDKCKTKMEIIAISSSSFHFKGLGWPGADAIKQRQRWYDNK